MWHQLLKGLMEGETRALARAISFVENEQAGYESLLRSLPSGSSAHLVGITGPPGAGKSTLVDALIGELLKQGKKVSVLCVDPSSPFHSGAVLGDRIRMSEWHDRPDVFIRSLASRGSMGGLHPHIIEISDLVKAAGFDYVIIETVGVGQSEVEIAALADTTVVVLVPESGDEVQTMKSGLMEIADIFVVNKSDRPGADAFAKNLRGMLAPAFHRHDHEIPVIPTVASKREGAAELAEAINNLAGIPKSREKKLWLLTEKAWHLIRSHRMKNISRNEIYHQLEKEKDINLYRFVHSLVASPAPGETEQKAAD